MKRVLDVLGAIVGLTLASPLLGAFIVAIWLYDRASPFYWARRVGMGGKEFYMLKLRSMVVNADKSGVNSTSADDNRITPVGRFVRAWKLDELTQLYNVLRGEMSFVGPRPNVKSETDEYTPVERGLLKARAGITDFASIVFSDEAEILRGSKNADLDYSRLIRPWKSRLGLFYIEHQSVVLDLKLIVLTAVALVSKKTALKGVHATLRLYNAPSELVRVCGREDELVASPPPGATEPVKEYGVKLAANSSSW